jgi:DNA-binding response OmpR family regulator
MEKKRILIVEDESRIALALCRSLEFPIPRRYEVEISPVAETAMAKLQDRPYDLIVTDLSLPGMSGLQFLRRVRRVSPQTRTMLITAYGSPQVKDLATELGAVYLAKPFSVHRFSAVVERILEEPERDIGRLPAPTSVEAQLPGGNGQPVKKVLLTKTGS